MQQADRGPESDQAQVRLAASLASVLGQVGCITLLLVAVALAGGLWLDDRLGTRPLITVVLVLGSVPVTMFLIVRIVLRTTARLQGQAGGGRLPAASEEGDRGKKP